MIRVDLTPQEFLALFPRASQQPREIPAANSAEYLATISYFVQRIQSREDPSHGRTQD